jgi:putative ABC transport system permease protein
VPQFRQRIVCPAPVAVTFDFVDDEENIPAWVLGVTRFTPTGEPTHGKGSKWDMSVEFGPLRNDLKLVCTDWVQNGTIVMRADHERPLQVTFTFQEHGPSETEVDLCLDYPDPETNTESMRARLLEPIALKAMSRMEARLRDCVAEYQHESATDTTRSLKQPPTLSASSTHPTAVRRLRPKWPVKAIQGLSVVSADRFRVLTAREMTAHPFRSVAAMVVIAVSAALIVAVMATYGSITGSVDRLTKSIVGNANFIVSGFNDAGLSQALLPAVAHSADVKSAIPVLQQQRLIDGHPTVILGFDPSVVDLNADLAAVTQDAFGALLGAPDGVVAGPAMQGHTGQSLQVAGREVTIVKVANDKAASRINGGRFIAAPLPLAQRLTDHAGLIDYIVVSAASGADLAAVRSDIERHVDGKAIVSRADLRTVQANSTVAMTRDATLLVASISLVVSAFLIFNSMTMVVAHRRPRIAMIRAIGATRRQIAGDLLVEAGLMGGVAALVGIPIGWFVSHWSIHQVPPFLLQSLSVNLTFIVPRATIPVVIVVCVLSSIAASASAAYQASHVSPLEALRSAELAPAESIPRRWSASALVAGFALCIGAFVMVFWLHGPLAFASAAVYTFGGILVGIALMGVISRAAGRLAARWGGAGRLAAAAIARSPRRAWGTAITAGIAVALGISVHGSLANIIAAGVESFAGLRDSQIFVSESPANALPNGPTLPAEWTSKIRGIPGVHAVGQGRWAYVTLGGDRVTVEGIDDANNGATGELLSPDVKRDVLNGNGIAISKQLAQSHHYGSGDTIAIGTPTGVHRAKVVATIDAISVDSGTITMDVRDTQQWFNQPGATYLAISTTPGTDVRSVEAAIAKTLPPFAYVYTGNDIYTAVTHNIRQAGVLAAGLQWIVSAIAAVAVMNTLMLAVLQRTREFGVIRAMGSSRRLISRLVMAEAAAVGIVGGVLGLALGIVVQYLATLICSRALGITIQFHPSITIVLYGIAGVALCILGALPPATTAARMDVIPAISCD